MRRLTFSDVLIVIFLLGFAPLRAQTKAQQFAEVDSLNDYALYSISTVKNYDEIQRQVQKTIQLATAIRYPKGQALALNNLGVVERYKGNYALALKQYLAALKIFDQHKLHHYQDKYANLLANISIAFLFAEDYKRGFEFGHKGITAAEKLKNKDALGRIYQTMGDLHIGTGKYDSAHFYHNLSLAIFKQTNNKELLAGLYVDMGIGSASAGDARESIAYTLKALDIYKRLKASERFATIFINVAQDYLTLKSYPRTILYLDSAEFHAKKLGQMHGLENIYELKAATYRKLRNVDSTALYFEKRLALKDSLYNATYKKELAALQTKSDIYVKEAENKLLVKDNRIAVLHRNLAITGILILAAVLGFILLQQKLRVQKRVKQQLEEEVASRTAQVVEQKEQLDKANLHLQLSLNRAKIDPHFVFNLLNSVQHLILEKSPVEAQDHLAKLSRLMRYVLEKTSLDKVPLQDELKMLEQYIQLEQLRLDHCFDYTMQANVAHQQSIPAMLLQPYVENAIVHGFAGLQAKDLILQLRVKELNGILIIEIEDNGRGRQKNGSIHHTSMGSALGQQRLEMLSRLHNKPYSVDIEDLKTTEGNNAGTRVTLKLPA